MSQFAVLRTNALIRGLMVVIILLFAGISWEQLRASESARGWTEHTLEVIGGIKDLNIAVVEAESSVRGFVVAGNEALLVRYTRQQGRLGGLIANLQTNTADNEAQQAMLRQVSELVQRRMAALAASVQQRREGGIELVQRLSVGPGGPLMADIERVLAAMTDEENRLLAARRQSAESRAVLVRVLVAVAVAAALGGLLVGAGKLNRALLRSNAAEAEQRAAGAQLRTTLDSLSQGVGVFDPDHRMLSWNECFQALLRLPKAMLRPDIPYGVLADHLAEGGVVLEAEARIGDGLTQTGEAVVHEQRRADGTVLEIRRTAVPGGGFVLAVTDMTKRAQAEGVLREAQKMQAIGQLTGGIAHDFNNLLTVILGNLEQVRKKLTHEPALQARLDRGIWAAGRGAALTSQLLAFARKQPLAPAPVDLGAAMPELVPLLRRTLGEHIDIRYVEPAALWPAMADPAQLESAILNLALNARDAMPGGGRLTIEMANKVLDEAYAPSDAEVTPGDYAMVAVSDTGHGMTKEVVARVFEPFFTTKPAGKGTGLGLAMVFGFIKQSGGHVQIYSEPGEGTTVRMYLPRASGAAAPVRAAVADDVPAGNATVLVVEDEEAVREVIVSALEELGYRVHQAGDAEAGLLMFGQHAGSIDLLLSDVVLPGAIRGRELAERIVSVRPEVQVLYMSGYTENTIIHHGRLDEGVNLISKPFSRAQLARKVAEVLRGAPAVTERLAGNVVALKSARGEG